MKRCVFTMIKDEHQYLDEFIQYNHSIGFDKIILVEDVNSKSHKTIVAKYPYAVLYKLMDLIDAEEYQLLISGLYRMTLVYKIFERLFKHDWDWMAFIDVDEYINADSAKIDEVLEMNIGKPYVYMRWVNMKCNGHIEHPNHWRPYSLFDTYTSGTFEMTNTKLFVNCSPRFDNITRWDKWENLPHKIIDANYNIDGKIFIIRHFLCKSFEEWIYRLKHKGEICTANWNRRVDDWFTINPEYRNQKDELIRKYAGDDMVVKKNDFP